MVRFSEHIAHATSSSRVVTCSGHVRGLLCQHNRVGADRGWSCQHQRGRSCGQVPLCDLCATSACPLSGFLRRAHACVVTLYLAWWCAPGRSRCPHTCVPPPFSLSRALSLPLSLSPSTHTHTHTHTQHTTHARIPLTHTRNHTHTQIYIPPQKLLRPLSHQVEEVQNSAVALENRFARLRGSRCKPLTSVWRGVVRVGHDSLTTQVYRTTTTDFVTYTPFVAVLKFKNGGDPKPFTMPTVKSMASRTNM